ncbi:uncharacterized protein JCM15063_005538 [Sporobolomyces koalae]|uniref:uncharacterized protein n=1 Tax=Sporobolomyces koalae TaxID=500713 RepID=UPI00316E19B1
MSIQMDQSPVAHGNTGTKSTELSKGKKPKKDKKRKEPEPVGALTPPLDSLPEPSSSTNVNTDAAGPVKKKSKKKDKYRDKPAISSLKPDPSTDPAHEATSSLPVPDRPSQPSSEYLLDPLFNFDFLRPPGGPTASTSSADATASTVVQPSNRNDIQVGGDGYLAPSTSIPTHTSGGGAASNSDAYDLPIPSASYHHVTSIPIYNNPPHQGEDIPVLPSSTNNGSSLKRKDRHHKDSSKSKKSNKKKKHSDKTDEQREAEIIAMQVENAKRAGIDQVEIQIDPQLLEPVADDSAVQALPQLNGEQSITSDQVQGAPSQKESKGKGKASSGEQGKKGKGKEKAVEPQTQSSLPNATTKRSTSAAPSGSGSNFPLEPIKPSRTPFDPITDLDDTHVETVTELEQDPEYVKPTYREGPFWNILQTKWTPVKDLKRIAEEYGETYKQGKFSSSEDRLIRATIKSFRQRAGMTLAEVITHINSKRHQNVASNSLEAGTGAKKSTKGSASASATTVAMAGGPLKEMWLDLGQALVERAMLGIWNHVRRMYNVDAGKGPWTAEEDETLRRAVTEFGQSSWEKIGTSVGRPSGDCRDRWTKQLSSGKDVKRGKWSDEEVEQLKELHREFGNSWTVISKKMGTRTATQCRIKWSDSLSRKEAASTPRPATPEVKTDLAASNGGAQEDSESKQDVKEPPPDEKDNFWKWKSENSSTLVHYIANLKLKNESEIDFAQITEPTLQPQGTKNLRDRFKRLRSGAILDIRERDNLKEEDKIPWQTIMDYLLEVYPEPGKAYKRTYRAAEKKRIERQQAKVERKLAKQEKARRKKEGTHVEGPESIPVKRSAKSQEIVHESDDGDSASDSSEEDSSDDE